MGSSMDAKVATVSRTDVGEPDGADGAAVPQPGLLLVYSGSRPRWAVLPIPQGAAEIELGRDNLSALVDDTRISRNHARVGFDASSGSFHAVDVGSRNGTWADGQLMNPNVQRAFERCLRIGDTLLLPAADISCFQGFSIALKDGQILGRVCSTCISASAVAPWPHDTAYHQRERLRQGERGSGVSHQQSRQPRPLRRRELRYDS